MPRLSDTLREYLLGIQGREVDLNQLRSELKIDKASPSWDGIRVQMLQLAKENIVRPSGKRDGIYKVVTQVYPIRVFNPDRKDFPIYELIFPRDFNTMMEMDFANDIVVREGDVILIAGMSNYFKTGLCLNFCGENIDKNPVLMGNEYTVQTEQGYDVSPRFYNRVKDMSEWVHWTNGDGQDKFTLLPVWDDYAEHIVRDRINIIDWINLPGEYYMISPLMEKIKKALGKGIGILVIQKAEGVAHGRGGAMTKEFADCEILLDNLGKDEILLTIGKVKESTKPVMGKTYAFSQSKGIKILNFRPVKKCPECFGQGFKKGEECSKCYGKKFTDC